MHRRSANYAFALICGILGSWHFRRVGTYLLSQDEAKQVAAEIADALGEKLHGPRRLVREVVERCGVDFARDALRDAEEVMALGGMLTAAADRLRTKGGVFFYLDSLPEKPGEKEIPKEDLFAFKLEPILSMTTPIL